MITLLLYIALFGFIVWLILQIPQIQPFRTIIMGVAIVILILFLIQYLQPYDVPLPLRHR